MPAPRRPEPVHVVVPPRELDVATRDEFARRVREAVASAGRGHRIVVDFTEVGFCDSSAVSVLLSGKARAARAGCAFEVHAPHRLLRRVSALLGADGDLGL